MKYFNAKIFTDNGLLCVKELYKNEVNILSKEDLLKNNINIKKNNIEINTIKIKASDLKNKVIYRYPNITLPTNKLSLLKQKYNLSVTRSESKADYKIVSKEFLNSLATIEYRRLIYLSSFEKYIEMTKSKWSPSIFKIIQDFKKTELDLDEDCLICLNRGLSMYSLGTLGDLPFADDYFYTVSDESFIFNISKSDNLILDLDMCSMTTEDSYIIDESNYDNINKMIESNSVDDITLALETIANCNIEKSFDKIALMFCFYTHQFKNQATNWNSVNVRSLRKRFSNYMHFQNNISLHVPYRYNKLIETLIKDEALTPFAFKVISLKMFNFFNKSLGFESSVFDFSLDDIKLKPQYKKHLVLNDHGQEVIKNEITKQLELTY